jgi:shikimate dehydrogenase
MHNAAFGALKLDYAFLAFKVKPVELENAVNGMRSLNIRGLNVTMPHKSAILKFLDRVDLSAQIINSVNTVLNKENKLFGFNTDGVGALKALRENGAEPKGRKVLLLGAGGAPVIAYAMLGIDELAVLNDPKTSPELAKLLKDS